MSNPIKGSPEVDKKYTKLVEELKKNTDVSTLRNLNQKCLRKASRDIKKVLADLDFYLDIRNEQGRGGK